MRTTILPIILLLAMNLTAQEKPLFCHAAVKISNGYQPNSAGLDDGYFMWDTGRTLLIRFLNGSEPIHKKIISIAKTWEQYANIRFKFIDSGDSHIRINLHGEGFLDAPIGNMANIFPQDEANVQMDTTSFSSVAKANYVVLHTFGHILGLHHENQVPLQGRTWNRGILFDYFSDHGWDEGQVLDRIIYPYSTTVSNNIVPDRLSVMYVSFPASWTNEKQLPLNTALSATDKLLVKAIYPRKQHPGKGMHFSVSDFKGFRIQNGTGGVSFYPLFTLSVKEHYVVMAVVLYDPEGNPIATNGHPYIFNNDLATVKNFPSIPGKKYEVNKTSNDLGFFLPAFEIPGEFRGQKLKLVFRIVMQSDDDDKELTYESKPYDFVWDEE